MRVQNYYRVFQRHDRLEPDEKTDVYTSPDEVDAIMSTTPMKVCLHDGIGNVLWLDMEPQVIYPFRPKTMKIEENSQQGVFYFLS